MIEEFRPLYTHQGKRRHQKEKKICLSVLYLTLLCVFIQSVAAIELRVSSGNNNQPSTSISSSKISVDPIQPPQPTITSKMNDKSVENKNHQKKQESIICQVCSVTFPSRNQLFRHIRQEHDDSIEKGGNNNEEDGDGCGDGRDLRTGAQRTAASIEARSKLSNEHHEAYYKIQASLETDSNAGDGNHTSPSSSSSSSSCNIFSNEEFSTAMEYFRLPLPVAFRLTRSTATETSLMRSKIEKYLIKEGNASKEGSLMASPFLDPNMSRVAIIPPREWSKEAQQVLMDAQDIGCFNRQELCSMIPPILLLHQNLSSGDDEDDNRSSSKVVTSKSTSEMTTTKATIDNIPTTVLDMCAAPGSKSLQLMDELSFRQLGGNVNTDSSPMAAPSLRQLLTKNMLVFNDPNRNRLQIATRRIRRHLASNSAVLTCSDGRHFPALRKFAGYKLKFDAVLCDAVCSGDGTLRKLGVQGWKDWNCKEHLQLHKLQVKLLARALQLVRKGGRVVYSTCSLDPIEDEAVVASALARVPGGPTAYRILRPPEYLQNKAEQRFEYNSGATQWVVPHPKFRANNPETYRYFNDVPKNLQHKDIVPSMFPPSTKREEDMALAFRGDNDADIPKVTEEAIPSSMEEEDENDKKKVDPIEQAKFYGDILSESDIAALEKMLPNCCRILPQHLDSGGFFCAIIERINPVYYAVCCPLERNSASSVDTSTMAQDNAEGNSGDTLYSKYHGRIFSHVESAKQLRSIVSQNKNTFGEEVYFEGLATLDLAHKWLRQHGAYVPGISDQEPISLLDEFETIANHKCKDAKEADKNDVGGTNHENLDAGGENGDGESQTKKRKVYSKPATYKPMFQSPHPSLTSEFCNFFGMFKDAGEAAKAGVARFPLEQLIITGGPATGGDEGSGSSCAISQIETCLDPDVAHTEVVLEVIDRDKISDGLKKIPRRRRFFQLILASDEIRSLYSGGARFSPHEVGLTLCSIAIPGPWRRLENKHSKPADDDKSTSRRPENCGRYGLTDRAAELIGCCATRRVAAATHDECFQLLKSGSLDVESADFGGASKVTSTEGENELHRGQYQRDETSWWQKWGKKTIRDTSQWEAGAVIVVCAVSSDNNGDVNDNGDIVHHSIFLSCVLRDCGDSRRRLELLSDKRIAESLMRLL